MKSNEFRDSEIAHGLSVGNSSTVEDAGTSGDKSSQASTSPAGEPVWNLRERVACVERETVREALTRTGGKKQDAARLLGISDRAMSYYVRKHFPELLRKKA